jgi:uncharacterized protein (DUF433 family)
MAIVETRYEHVILNEEGVPLIAGTTMKVVELVVSQRAYGWSPDELQFQYPHLTLGQIHSALAYYWDHQAELDRLIEQQRAQVQELRRTTPPTPFAARMRAQRQQH